MGHLKKNLAALFLLMGLCQAFSLMGFFLPLEKFFHLAFTPLYLGFAYSILVFRISGKDGLDYWGYQEADASGAQENIELIVQGNVIESDLDEDKKEERFLRVADHSGRLFRKILIVIYGLSFIALRTLSQKLFGEVDFFSQVIPFSMGAIVLFTTTYGHLLFLPFASLVTAFILSPLKNAHSFENSFFIFGLFLSFSATIMMTNLLINPQKGESSPYQIAITKLKESLPIAIILMALFFTFDFILPKSLWEKEQKQPQARARLHKINRELGKKFNGPSKKEVQDRSDLLENIDLSQFKPQNFQKALGGLQKQMDQVEGLINSEMFKGMEIPQMDKNVLINTNRELQQERAALKERLQSKDEYTAEDIKALSDFIDKFQGFKNELSGHGIKVPRGQGDELSQQFNKGIKDSLAPLNKGVATLPEGAEKEELMKSIDELAKSLESKAATLSHDSPTSVASAPQTTPESTGGTSPVSLEEIKEKTSKAVKKENKASPLISPKLLNKILEHLKTLFLGAVLLFILGLIQRVLSGDKVESTNSKEVNELKKALLKKKKYESAAVEINDRYNIFLEAVRKVHFSQEEPPPPKVLESFLKENSPANPKALNYLTEVFSQSFYGRKSFSNDILKKYRKAFRVLIKGL